MPYKSDLNDGVIINAAPLNSLFKLRSWANDIKKVWDKLKKAEYDWAPLAYMIWPDRVRNVCKKDRTTTTPGSGWKHTRKKNIVEALAAHRIPYAATASIAYPDDMIRKFEKARRPRGGSRFIYVFATCPTGWRVPTEMSIRVARLAVQTRIFPLYEVEDGVRYTLNATGDRPVADYLEGQGRFKHLTDADIAEIQEMVDLNFRF